jgi:hypothetical protein
MTTLQIISARVLRPTVRRECAECGKEIGPRMLRVAVKEGARVLSLFYCPQIDEDDEIRGCAPDHPLVRAAIRHPFIA